MIFGDPDKFALYFDMVPEWTIGTEMNGISGFYINGSAFMTNHGLISLDDEFYNFFSKIKNMKDDAHLFALGGAMLLKYLIAKRFPNWWAFSQKDWANRQWYDVEECEYFDFGLESFSRGNAEQYCLFIIKNKGLLKILMYTCKDRGFYDFSQINSENIFTTEIGYDILLSHIKNLEQYLDNLRNAYFKVSIDTASSQTS